jgi:hypothetical protein
MESSNFILDALEYFALNPQGMFTGAIGALIRLFIINHKNLTLRYSAFVLIVGFLVCGFTIDGVRIWIKSEQLSSLINVVVSILLSDVLARVQEWGPNFAKLIVGKGYRYVDRKLPDHPSPSGGDFYNNPDAGSPSSDQEQHKNDE